MIAALNTLWMAACAREALAFGRATRRVAQTQADVLATIVRDNRKSSFGRAHGFATLDTPEAFIARVPLSRYQDYAADIERIAHGSAGVLTAEPVELLEPTSGSTGGSTDGMTGGEKWIPMTCGLRRQFQRAVAAWIWDLLAHRPALRGGRAYWSISPAMPTRRTPGGLRVGFGDDAEYLGGLERFVLRRLLAVPSEVARLGDIGAFRYRTLLHLLAAEDLTLISVWSPTFLTALLEPLEEWLEALCFDLSRGRPGGMACPARAAWLRRVFKTGVSWPEKLQRVWPQLALISCWADAGATRYIGGLQALFPAVELQPKGLLATEGCVSFPLLGRPGAALAIRSHFFEFQEIDDPCTLRLAHALDRGGRYRVVLTTAGDLYRYELRDEVEVVGFEHQCPLVRFTGKADCISDLVGEKLAEPHVRAAIEAVLGRHRIPATFAMVTPVDETPPRYCLFLASGEVSDRLRAVLAEDLDRALRTNPHYAYARDLSQLAALEVAVLDAAGPGGWALYEQARCARGMRAGNIKPTALGLGREWPRVFAPALARCARTSVGP